MTGVLQARLRELALPEATDAHRIVRLLRRAVEETRRVSRGLSPVHPEPEGLENALRELAAQTGNVFGIVCRLHRPKPVLISDSEGATHLYRIAQEAVTNAVRHGRARRISIGLSQWRGKVILSITDNGRDRHLIAEEEGAGLAGHAVSRQFAQGSITVESSASGGTKVRCVALAPHLRRREPVR